MIDIPALFEMAAGRPTVRPQSIGASAARSASPRKVGRWALLKTLLVDDWAE